MELPRRRLASTLTPLPAAESLSRVGQCSRMTPETACPLVSIIGLGRDLGMAALEGYTEVKNVYVAE